MTLVRPTGVTVIPLQRLLIFELKHCAYSLKTILSHSNFCLIIIRKTLKLFKIIINQIVQQ